MPHYQDGTEAFIGDQVIGKLYNTEGNRVGVIVSITPGVDSCNAMVAFTEVIKVDSDGESLRPRMAIDKRRAKSQDHQSSGPEIDIWNCQDYCAIKELIKIGP